MKKLIFRNSPLLLSLLILILVGNLQTKNKTHTNIAGTMKQVIHQIAREKGHIPLGLGSAHELIEAIAKDPIVYRDIARENHIVINRDNWHGISPTDMPLGRELYSIYRSMADYGMIDRYELRDIFEAMQYTPINEWELWMLPEKVQRKIIAIYQIAKSSDPKKLVSALVKNSHLTLVFESHSTPEILEFKTPHNQKIKSKNEFEEISEQIQNSTKKMGQDLHSWARIYGGSNSDTASSIQQTIDGGYIVAGRTGSFGAGYIDSWILKLDSVGDIEWQHTYGGIDSDRASSIQQTTDGGYIVAGYTHSFGAGDNDYWVLKLSSSGDIEWQRTYGGSSTPGHVRENCAYSIQQTSDGGYIVAGSTWSFGAGWHDFLILKLTSSGDIEWQRTYGGTDGDKAYSIQQTLDGGYIVAGYSESFYVPRRPYKIDILVLKLSSSGEILYFPEIVVGITTVTVSDTSITPQDTYIVPQEINITPQDTNIIPQNSNARESWLFSLPLNFTGKMELNRSLSQAEYINVLTWEANPNNEDLNIVKYRIYQVEGESQSLLVELNAGTFKYWHRNVEKDKEYAYVIVAVNDDGGEGVPAYVKVQ